MAAIPGWRLVEAWERGRQAPAPVRALTLLQLAQPDQTIEQLATIPVGERDRRLLRLREELCGGAFEASATCPRCGELLEAAFAAEEVSRWTRVPLETPVVEVAAGELELTVRFPTTADVMEASRAGSREGARAVLARKCTVAIRKGEEKATVNGELPERVVAAIEESLAEADPVGDLKVALRCPGCDYAWEVQFDAATYLWDEVETRARRALRETHALARAYGWSEAEILNLSEFRRQCYLELLGDS